MIKAWFYLTIAMKYVILGPSQAAASQHQARSQHNKDRALGLGWAVLGTRMYPWQGTRTCQPGGDSAAWRGGPYLSLQGAWGGSGSQEGQLGCRRPGWVGTFLTSCLPLTQGCRRAGLPGAEKRLGQRTGSEHGRALESPGLPRSLSHCPSQAPPSPLAAGGFPPSGPCSPSGLALITRCVTQV